METNGENSEAGIRPSRTQRLLRFFQRKIRRGPKKPKYYFDKDKPIKKEIRLIGIDDAPFNRFKKGEVPVIGTIHRGGGAIEGVLSTRVDVDGVNSTDRIIEMINKSRHKDQLQCIMLDGIAVGGFNVIDIRELADRTRLPVIIVIRNKPNLKRVLSALKNVPNSKEKAKLIAKAGKIREVKVGDGKIYFQCKGIVVSKAKEIIQTAVSRGHMPEPIRTAHLIAAGIVEGESKGRA
ncbi:MAG: DUF99 family protein [Nanoarchaeota archaeon]|nr:DUF99 family protein [Nanoarchaeota archaeon]